MKLDLSKAYNTADWDFAVNLLLALRFPTRFVTWVSRCMKKAVYSLVINRGNQGHFNG